MKTRNTFAPQIGILFSLGLLAPLWGQLVIAAEPPELDALLNISFDQLSAVDTNIEAGSRLVADFKSLPQTVTVLSASDIRAFGYRTLAEVINGLPGTHTSSDHTCTYLGARGMIASGSFNSRLLVTIDGMQINDNIYQQVGLAGQEFPLDIDLIDRVEFIPGPGSVAYGNNAFLGVVNVITRSSASKEHGDLAASIDSNGELIGRGTAHIPVAGGHALVSVTQYDHQGIARNYAGYGAGEDAVPAFRTQAETDKDRNEKLFVKYEKGRLHFNFIHSDRQKGAPSGIAESEFNNPYNQFRDRWLISNLNYRWIDTAKSELVSRVYWGNYRFNADYALSEPASFSAEASEGSWVGVELKGAWRGIQNHVLSGGIQTQHNYRQWLHSADMDNAGNTDVTINTNRKSQTSALWLEDQFEMNPQTKLIVGARMDQDAQQKAHLSPRLGGVYQWDQNNTLRLNLARNFLSPSDYELRYGSSNSTDSASQAPNPFLIPESMESLDVGWEHNNSHFGRIVLSSFVYKANDLIELSQNDAGQAQHLNLGSSTGKGVQAEWQHNWTADWRMTSSLTLQTVTDQGIGHRVDLPETLAKLQLRTPKFWSVQPAVEWLYASDRLTRDGRTLEASHLMNLTFSRPFANQVIARFSVYNLFDNRYETPVSIDYPMSAVQQNGRVARLKLEWSF